MPGHLLLEEILPDIPTKLHLVQLGKGCEGRQRLNWALSVTLALCFSGTWCVSSVDWTRRLRPSSSSVSRWGPWCLDTFRTGLTLSGCPSKAAVSWQGLHTHGLAKATRGAEKGENTIVKGELSLPHPNWIKVILRSNARAKCWVRIMDCFMGQPVRSPPEKLLWPWWG